MKTDGKARAVSAADMLIEIVGSLNSEKIVVRQAAPIKRVDKYGLTYISPIEFSINGVPVYIYGTHVMIDDKKYIAENSLDCKKAILRAIISRRNKPSRQESRQNERPADRRPARKEVFDWLDSSFSFTRILRCATT